MNIALPAELPRLSPRAPESHKGTFGTALLIGGSVGMTGAIILAGRAALRGGAGLVRVGVPARCVSVVASGEPSYLTIPLPEDRSGRISLSARRVIERQLGTATAVAVGPGLGRSDGLDALVWWLYEVCPKPLVVDADGLNALAARKGLLGRAPVPAGPRIITPHPGEFDRLVGRGKLPPEERFALQRELVQTFQAVVVLKGHRTRVSDGDKLYVNPTGNPGMATGGSGDVLTGLIVALLCQGLQPFESAVLGVFLHGLSGDLAAEELGQESLTASDLVDYLPRAFRAYRQALASQEKGGS
ncbi:MAG: NAD(P)H-hydrate dehydratase [Thermoguttaceae bacterium]|nr:NAD(P)H-hydrate dehydratase [Thermoguttaceae bacterium]MDW8079129.1 NAD(P)H-hydrate dehydratase [Thermoguttaceae bacterium]